MRRQGQPPVAVCVAPSDRTRDPCCGATSRLGGRQALLRWLAVAAAPSPSGMRVSWRADLVRATYLRPPPCSSDSRGVPEILFGAFRVLEQLSKFLRAEAPIVDHSHVLTFSRFSDCAVFRSASE